MLANLLSGERAHPLLPECQVITDLIRERLRSEQEVGAAKFTAFFQSGEFADGIFRNAIESILAEVLKSSDTNPEFLVLKDPSLLHYLGVIDRLLSWPMLKICIVRDPRDAIASYINVGIRNGCRPHIDEAIQFMAPYYPPLLAEQDRSGTTLTIRYEDLVRKDEATQLRLSEHMGYPVDLDSYRGMSAELLDTTDAWYTPLLGKGIDAANIRLFERVISPDEYYLINETFRDVLDTFYSDELVFS